MENFNQEQFDFTGREFNLELLEELYRIPTSVLSTKEIAKGLSQVTGQMLDTVMVSKLFNEAGLPLRNRARTYPKPETVKEPRVTKADVLNNLFGQLGIVSENEENTDTEAVNGEITEVEQESIDEAVEQHQFDRVFENGVV